MDEEKYDPKNLREDVNKENIYNNIGKNIDNENNDDTITMPDEKKSLEIDEIQRTLENLPDAVNDDIIFDEIDHTTYDEVFAKSVEMKNIEMDELKKKLENLRDSMNEERNSVLENTKNEHYENFTALPDEKNSIEMVEVDKDLNNLPDIVSIERNSIAKNAENDEKRSVEMDEIRKTLETLQDEERNSVSKNTENATDDDDVMAKTDEKTSIDMNEVNKVLENLPGVNVEKKSAANNIENETKVSKAIKRKDIDKGMSSKTEHQLLKDILNHINDLHKEIIDRGHEIDEVKNDIESLNIAISNTAAMEEVIEKETLKEKRQIKMEHLIENIDGFHDQMTASGIEIVEVKSDIEQLKNAIIDVNIASTVDISEDETALEVISKDIEKKRIKKAKRKKELRHNMKNILKTLDDLHKQIVESDTELAAVKGELLSLNKELTDKETALNEDKSKTIQSQKSNNDAVEKKVEVLRESIQEFIRKSVTEEN